MDGQFEQSPGGWHWKSVGQNILPPSFLHAMADGCSQIASSAFTAVFQPHVLQSFFGLQVMSRGQYTFSPSARQTSGSISGFTTTSGSLLSATAFRSGSWYVSGLSG